MIQHFNLFDGEECFVDEMIIKNPMNNSVWSYRYFIISKTKEFSKELVEAEVNYAFDILYGYKLDNEAAWVYLRGYLATSQEEAERSQNTNAKRMIITEFPFIKEKCEDMLKTAEEESPGYRFIYVLLLDYLNPSVANDDNCRKQAIEICEKLASTYDQIRENYWTYRKAQLEQI